MGLPILLMAGIGALIASMPVTRGPLQTDRLMVGVLGIALVAALVVMNHQRRRRGQSLGMAAVGLVEAPGRGLCSTAELRRLGVEVSSLDHRAQRPWRIIAVLLVMTVLVALIAIAVGSRTMTLPEVLLALFEPTDRYNDLVVRQRAPRAMMAVSVGFALGVAGALIQGQTRNPLADPDVLGITCGATFAAVLAIWLGGLSAPSGYVWFALLGALVVATVVVLLAETIDSGVAALPLLGAAIAAVLGGATGMVLLLDQAVQNSFRQWMVGGLADRPLSTYVIPLIAIALGLLLAGYCAPALNALSLGSEMATALGNPVRRTRILTLLAVGLLVGAATAACGPIAFLGLIAAHTARILVGLDHRFLIPVAGLIGALTLSFADVIGRVILRPSELQAGIVFALLGAPVFVTLTRMRTGN